MYFLCNTELRSRNHCCRGKAISITHSECEFVALIIQHAMRMRYIVICGLADSTIIFTHYLINGTIFGEKELLKPKCVCFDFLYKICPKIFSF